MASLSSNSTGDMIRVVDWAAQPCVLSLLDGEEDCYGEYSSVIKQETTD